jgi:hypothetical protein
MVLAFVVFAALVTSACAQGGQDTPSGEDNGGGQKGTSEKSNPVVRQEPAIQHDERQILTGVISDKEMGPCPYSKGPCTRILVEEAPDADCRGGRGPLEPGCEKMYFDVTGKTVVLRKEGDTRKASSSAELHEGLRVSADYTGYDVAESYPSQTAARVVTILGSR